MQIKRYSRSEPLVFLWIMGPYILGMNLIIFGSCILKSLHPFLLSFIVSSIYLGIGYLVFGSAAQAIKKQFPAAGDLFRRIGIMLPVFYVLNIIWIKGLVFLYQQLNLISCSILENNDWWAILFGCIMSTVITFINEGMTNFEAWKLSINETEKLKNIYQRSNLLGLKGQINPHFLFNCFNTLSGLIQENPEKAEKFLDEMTKVDRYLLRSDEDLLVPVAEELKFAGSYLYLIKERFGKAIQINIDEPRQCQDCFLPPLSLQAVLENIIYSNAICKDDPLKIKIEIIGEKELTLTHSVHEKRMVETLEDENEGLDNLVNKYLLLKAGKVTILEEGDERIIRLPIIKEPITML